MHTCNAWCFGGIHALLFDSEVTERATLERTGLALAQREGLQFVAVAEVRPAGSPAPGTPTASGIARGRIVVWARAK